MVDLQGVELSRAFAAATNRLELYRDAINALNVFPVPDGDTGTNMLLTMRSALEKCPQAADAGAGAVASGLADVDRLPETISTVVHIASLADFNVLSTYFTERSDFAYFAYSSDFDLKLRRDWCTLFHT